MRGYEEKASETDGNGVAEDGLKEEVEEGAGCGDDEETVEEGDDGRDEMTGVDIGEETGDADSNGMAAEADAGDVDDDEDGETEEPGSEDREGEDNMIGAEEDETGPDAAECMARENEEAEDEACCPAGKSGTTNRHAARRSSGTEDGMISEDAGTDADSPTSLRE